MNYQITITGYDWNTCYLHYAPNTKTQVLNDLQKEIDERGSISIVGDQFQIDVVNHSVAMEFFKIINIDQDIMTVEMEYEGGIS